jgi:predicted nucleotidyltransferase
MENNEIYSKIRTIVHSYLPDASVLLYGSRAKNTMNENSDYDLLIVVNNELTLNEKMQLESKIDKALVWSLDVPFDVILKDIREIERFKSVKGHIIYYALKEAIVI